MVSAKAFGPAVESTGGLGATFAVNRAYTSRAQRGWLEHPGAAKGVADLAHTMFLFTSIPPPTLLPSLWAQLPLPVR